MMGRMFIPKHLLGIALLLCLPLNGCEKGEEPTTATSENAKAPKPIINIDQRVKVKATTASWMRRLITQVSNQT